MRSKDVIALAPYAIGLGTSLFVASYWTSAPTSSALVLASVVICSACVGALLTHYPRESAPPVEDRFGD